MAEYFDKFAFYLLAFIVIFSVFSNLFWPVTDWDAITLYDFRGKLMNFGEQLKFKVK